MSEHTQGGTPVEERAARRSPATLRFDIANLEIVRGMAEAQGRHEDVQFWDRLIGEKRAELAGWRPSEEKVSGNGE